LSDERRRGFFLILEGGVERGERGKGRIFCLSSERKGGRRTSRRRKKENVIVGGGSQREK